MGLYFQKVNSENQSIVNRLYPGDKSKFWIDFNWYWLGICTRRTNINSYLVFFDDSKLPIGFVIFGQHYSDRFLKNKIDGKAEIYHTVVDEDYQRKGLGKMITSISINKLLSELNYNEVLIAANPENSAASSLYKSLGFLEVSKNYDGDPLYSISNFSELVPDLPTDLSTFESSKVSEDKRNQWEQESLKYSDSFNWENWENEISND